ncbi:MAG TPA: PIN domain nuclease [Vicinamibacterales bacterium]|nr:PIN domain nuclease [Vicinamibacterales bacterium]
MVIVDTTVWIDYLAGRQTEKTAWLHAHATQQPMGLTDLTLCEILQGVRDAKKAARLHKDLQSFQIFDTGGEALAVAAAHHYRHLRARGHTVRGTIDCLIATFCLAHGHTLLHDDRDYDPFEQELGLSVLHPPPLS